MPCLPKLLSELAFLVGVLLDLPVCRSSALFDWPHMQRRPTYKVCFLGGRVPLDLRFRGPLEAWVGLMREDFRF